MILKEINPDIANPILKAYVECRAHSENLCAPLEVEDYIPQPEVFTSPPKWHLAHTTWFFEEMICKKYNPDYKVFDDKYSFLFNSYYNSIGQRIERHQRGLISRPNVETIYAYRQYVDRHISILFEKNPIPNDIEELIILGINHEQQHQELLLSDLKYTFSLNPTYPKYNSKPYVNTYNKRQGWINIDGGLVNIGYNGSGFCFDNELGNHQAFLESFEIAEGLVTNGDYVEFIESGGYKNSKFWLDAGWDHVKKFQLQSPLYWHQLEGSWYHYTLSGLEKLDMDAQLCHISHYEAMAYASFKGCRLPTEFEWEHAASQIEWGTRWEWTNSAYLPYPRFKIKEGAVGEYNGKFMNNQIVLRGSSVATPPGHSRKTYRNFFPSDMRWQFCGIRLVK